MKKVIAGLMLLGIFTLAAAEDSLNFEYRENTANQELLDEGKYQVEVGNYAAGRENLEKYLLKEQSAEAYLYLIRARRLSGDLAGANSLVKRTETRYPEDMRIRYERILVLDKLIENETKSQWRKERYREEYYEVYESYLEMTGYEDSSLIFELGNKYFIDDLYEKANLVFLKDRNGDIKNLFGGATTSRFLGKYRKSIGLYTRVLEADPNFYEAYLGRGSSYQLAGDLGKGIKDMERYLEYKKDVDVYLAVANMYMSLERYSSAKSVLERASNDFPASKEVREMLVEVYSKLKR